MSRKPNTADTNFFVRLYNDIKEYFERCFGVNDIETRYLREAQEHERKMKSRVVRTTREKANQ